MDERVKLRIDADGGRVVLSTAPPHLVAWAFGIFGAIWGVCQVVVVDMRKALALSQGDLGTAMTIGVCGAILSMLVGGRVTDRCGPRLVIATTALFMGLSVAGLAVAWNYQILCVVLATFYAASGAYDIGINAAAIDAEQASGRRIITLFHATFSGAAAVSSMLAGLLLSAGMRFRDVYLIAAALAFVPAFLIMSHPGFVRPRSGQSAALSHNHRVGKLLRLPGVLLMAAISALGFFAEGTLQSWSAIYLRNSLDLPIVLSAAGPAGVHAAMAIGRLLSAYVVARCGRRTLLCLAGALTSLGMGVALVSETPVVVLTGFLICGLTQAGIAPAVYSLAGDSAPSQAGGVTSVIATISYSGFLLGPALIGGLADLRGLRVALGTVVLAGLTIIVLSLFVREANARHRHDGAS